MTEPKLDKDAMLTTEARRIVFDCLMQGIKPTEAAKKAHLSPGYVHKWVSECNINALVRQEKAKSEAKTAEKLEITRETQVAKYQANYAKALQLGQISAANGAIAGQNALLGLDILPAGNPADREPATREELEEALKALDKLESKARTIQFEVNKRVG
ncbi:MAG TPA: hypothetical protein HPP87_07320 [Planctomycetes bacterium]|nr:hypothetical protein [Planctomycetota bacterium]